MKNFAVIEKDSNIVLYEADTFGKVMDWYILNPDDNTYFGKAKNGRYETFREVIPHARKFGRPAIT